MEGTHSQKNLSVDAVGSVVTTAQRWETIISHPRVHGEVPCLLEVMAREGIDGDQFVLWMSELGKFNAKERQVQGGREGGREAERDGRSMVARGWARDLHGEWPLSSAGDENALN